MRNNYESDQLCQVERGLWTPALCGAKAIENCSNCQKPICQEHIHKLDNQAIVCVSCFVVAKHGQIIPNNATNPYGFQDAAWYYFERMRHTPQNNNKDFNRSDYNAFNYTSREYLDIPQENKDTFFDS